MATDNNAPMTTERLAEMGTIAAEDGSPSAWNVLALLAEVERLRAVIADQQAELAAMRPIVEAVAESHENWDVCEQLCAINYMLDAGESDDPGDPDAPTAYRFRHDESCIGEQARAYLASHPEQPEPAVATAEGEGE